METELRGESSGLLCLYDDQDEDEDGRKRVQTQVHGVTAAACDFGGPREVTLRRQLVMDVNMDMDSDCVVSGAILGGVCRDRQNQTETIRSRLVFDSRDFSDARLSSHGCLL